MVKNNNDLFGYHPNFSKELDWFIRKRKCPSLKSDLEILKKRLIRDLNKNYRPKSFYHRISGLDECVTEPAYVIKDFRCKKINKGVKSGFRITFLIIDEERFYFTEIYHKNKKEVEDKERINKLFRIN